MNYVTNDQAYGFFSKVSEDFADVNGKIPSNASSGNKMVTASDIATKADLVDGKVPAAQLPSFVDDVLEYASTSAFPATGETGKIYVALDTNKTYRWGGSDYVEISESLALGETSSTAYAGDKGKANADAISDIQNLIPSGASTSNKLATASDIPTVPTTDQTYDATSTNPQSGVAVASAISGKADTSDIPTALADLTDDSTHRVVTDTEKSTWSGKQDALTFDNTPTANSNNPVKSGGIKTALDDKMSYADNGVLGAKNLLKITKQTTTIDGITYSVDSNGVININGTATKTVTFTVADNLQYIKNKEESSILNGISGGSGSTYLLYVRYNESGTETYEETYSGDKALASDKQIDALLLQVKNGKTVSNVKIYPMIRLASDPDDTYAPYAMTNRELTDELSVQESECTGIIEGATVTINKLQKVGKVVNLTLKLTGVTSTAYSTVIANIPNGYKPKYEQMFWGVSSGNPINTVVGVVGAIQPGANISNNTFNLFATWITS